MKDNRELLLNAKEIIKQDAKLGDENCLVVADNRVEKIVILYHHVDNYFCKAQSINFELNWLVIYYFC